MSPVSHTYVCGYICLYTYLMHLCMQVCTNVSLIFIYKHTCNLHVNICKHHQDSWVLYSTPMHVYVYMQMMYLCTNVRTEVCAPIMMYKQANEHIYGKMYITITKVIHKSCISHLCMFIYMFIYVYDVLLFMYIYM